MVEQLVQAKLSITRACQIAGLSRAAYYKKPMPALNAIVTQHGRWGFWTCFTRLRLDGRGWNKKRVYRVYCDLGLNLPRRCKNGYPTGRDSHWIWPQSLIVVGRSTSCMMLSAAADGFEL